MPDNDASIPAVVQPYIGVLEKVEAFAKQGISHTEDDGIVTIESNGRGGVQITVKKTHKNLYDAFCTVCIPRSRSNSIIKGTPIFSDPDLAYAPK
jgi:hypothetical protein